MKDKFKESLTRVLVHEGGKVDDPQDPGGRTNKGVTQRVYSAWRKNQGLGVRDVYKMTDDECRSIYRAQYWDTIKGDDLPPGVDYVLFDGAVNSGCSQSVKWLQRALGVTADGQLGNVTLSKVKGVNDHDALVQAICDQRMTFLRHLKTFKRFGKGWTTRVNNVLATGQAWAMGSVGPEVEYVAGAEAKAEVEDAKPLPSRTPADMTTGVGATITAAGAGLAEVKDTLAPVTDLGYLQHVVVALTVAGVVLAIAGLVYRLYITRKKREIAHAMGNEVV